MNLLQEVQVDQVLGYFAAGVTKCTSSIVDMQNYEGVMFICELGTLIAGGTLDCYVEENSANSTSGMARLSGQAVYTVTSGDAAQTQSAIGIDVYQPIDRYVQCNITPATQNAVILGITAIRYNGKLKPPANGTLLSATQLVSPSEGV